MSQGGGHPSKAKLIPFVLTPQFKKLDVTDLAAVETWIEEIAQEFDGIDGLVSCAGIVMPQPRLHELDLKKFAKVIDVNMYGTVYFDTVVLRHFMKQNAAKRAQPKGGYAILNMGSKGSVEGLPGSPDYTASKHAVLGLTKVISKDYAADGVRANCLCPGLVSFFDHPSQQDYV